MMFKYEFHEERSENLILDHFSPAVQQVLKEYRGATFESGLYRVFSVDEVSVYSKYICQYYPQYDGAEAFAVDWMGSLLITDPKSNSGGCLLVEAGTSNTIRIPYSPLDFITSVAFEHHEEIFGSDLFYLWLRSSGESFVPHKKCIGFIKPMFLSGEYKVENLEVSDLSVYLEICGQLKQQLLDSGRV